MKKFFLKNRDLESLKSNVSKLENPALKNAVLDTLSTNDKLGGGVGEISYSRVLWGKATWSKVVVLEPSIE
ncbi:hypothetical protein GCM10022217_03220 [Chryseobacterium ginsenosidimutans]|uniref:hypothetical protein n=1 Tax=Chryseobacterium ginsenosidimutans TaxID=687846 RepID=UPI0031DD78DE